MAGVQLPEKKDIMTIKTSSQLCHYGRQRNVPRIITCRAIFLLIKSFVWWRSRCRCRLVLRKVPIDVVKSKNHIKRHMTDNLQVRRYSF